jgi:hypothetical protein
MEALPWQHGVEDDSMRPNGDIAHLEGVKLTSNPARHPHARAARRGCLPFLLFRFLHASDAVSLRPPFRLDQLEFHGLAVSQTSIPIALDVGKVDEDIFPFFLARDEPVSLLTVEPFDTAGDHLVTSGELKAVSSAE